MTEEFKKQIETQARQAVTELLAEAKLKKGDVFVVGCSSSEIVGGHIGKDSSLEAAQAVYAGIAPVLAENGIWLAAQCCEHLNRAIIIEREAAEKYGWEEVCVVPRPHAGGSWATTCWKKFREPVAVEEIRAHAGIDIGGTNVKIGLLDETLELTAEASIPFPHTTAVDMAKKIRAAVLALLEERNASLSGVESLGAVVPGSIDASGETVLDAHNLDFHDVPLRRLLQEQFPGIPVYIANDANGAALAELYKGAFVGCKTGVLLTLGTGLGGGIILNGKMFNGGMNHGVELGHAYLVDGGEPCTCGNHGCMEAYCAASALTREGRRAMQAHPESMLAEKTGSDPAKITPKLVTDCAKAGDPAATAVFDDYIEHLSSACASIYNILDPEVLALGGGLSAAGPFLFDPLQDKVSKKCFYSTRGKLVPAVLGNEAGMIGAALLARDAEA